MIVQDATHITESPRIRSRVSFSWHLADWISELRAISLHGCCSIKRRASWKSRVSDQDRLAKVPIKLPQFHCSPQMEPISVAELGMNSHLQFVLLPKETII